MLLLALNCPPKLSEPDEPPPSQEEPTKVYKELAETRKQLAEVILAFHQEKKGGKK